MDINIEELKIRKQDLVENPTPRVAIGLVLDTSGSMSGEPVAELNEGVKVFFDAIRGDETARYAAEICVVTFGGMAASKLLDFASIERQNVPCFDASGNTPMGQGVNIALDLLDQRKKEYSQAGVDYYQPWLVLMTDGQPTDEIEVAVKRTVELLEKKKLTIFPIGVGPSADMNTLARFSPKRAPIRLKGLNFAAFFEWLSKSVSRVSQSTPGEKVQLDIEGLKGWGEL